MSKKVLVTGGAGYIGSHVVLQLCEAGYEPVVLDNLSTGFRPAVIGAPLLVGDTGDKPMVTDILAEYEIQAVLHFAAHTIVPESVEQPLKYYGNNTCSTRNLLECCQQHGVKQFIFSSTAAVYGIPEHIPAYEDAPKQPINPYGTSKLMTEWMLQDLGVSSGMQYVILRYFNVAGSDPDGRIGQSTEKATLLIKVACEAALGKRDHIAIFGTDYATKDGTGIRDYIHVHDLADAHIKALQFLQQGGQSQVLNCGYGHGFSVREVLDTVAKIHASPLNIVEKPRRAGDPPSLVAGVDKIRSVLQWQPAYDDLEKIVSTSLDWEKKLASLPEYWK